MRNPIKTAGVLVLGLATGAMLGSHGTFIMMSDDLPSVRLDRMRQGIGIQAELHGSTVRKEYRDPDRDGRMNSYGMSSRTNYGDFTRVEIADVNDDGIADTARVQLPSGQVCNYQSGSYTVFEMSEIDLVSRCERDRR